MRYSYCTPETVESTAHQCKDVRRFIRSVKNDHPNVELGKADLWVLDWTRPGYARGSYIVLRDVSEDDLRIIREELQD